MTEVDRVADHLIGLAAGGCPGSELATLAAHAVGRWRLDCGERVKPLADRLEAILTGQVADWRERADALMRCGLAIDGRRHQEMADRLAKAQIPSMFRE